MIRLANFKSLQRVLFLGAHSDDIEIGAGGTAQRIIEEAPGVEIQWVVFSGDENRREEARISADEYLKNVEHKKVELHTFRDGYFPYEGAAIKDCFEELGKEFNPDLIFTHYRDDRHQDHRIVSDLTWNTFRNHIILEYEIPKYDGDLASPNVFVEVNETQCKKKAEILERCFRSQSGKAWFNESTFIGLMRIRGMEANANGGAEGFYCRKMKI